MCEMTLTIILATTSRWVFAFSNKEATAKEINLLKGGQFRSDVCGFSALAVLWRRGRMGDV